MVNFGSGEDALFVSLLIITLIGNSSPCDYDLTCVAYKRPKLHHTHALVILVNVHDPGGPPFTCRTLITDVTFYLFLFWTVRTVSFGTTRGHVSKSS